jgi:hypothetical protein
MGFEEWVEEMDLFECHGGLVPRGSANHHAMLKTALISSSCTGCGKCFGKEAANFGGSKTI